MTKSVAELSNWEKWLIFFILNHAKDHIISCCFYKWNCLSFINKKMKLHDNSFHNDYAIE